jgi:hypothetical protein
MGLGAPPGNRIRGHSLEGNDVTITPVALTRDGTRTRDIYRGLSCLGPPPLRGTPTVRLQQAMKSRDSSQSGSPLTSEVHAIPKVGVEPTTSRLLDGRSPTELSGKVDGKQSVKPSLRGMGFEPMRCETLPPKGNPLTARAPTRRP